MKIKCVHLVFLASALFQSIVCMDRQVVCVPKMRHTKILTEIQKPCFVAFLAEGKFFVGGPDGFEVLGPRKMWGSYDLGENNRLYDLAVNNIKNKFIVSTTGGKIVRFNADSKQSEWRYELKRRSNTESFYFPIIFTPNSQNQVMMLGSRGNSSDIAGLMFSAPISFRVPLIWSYHHSSGRHICFSQLSNGGSRFYIGETTDLFVHDSILGHCYSFDGQYNIINCRKTGIHITKITENEKEDWLHPYSLIKTIKTMTGQLTQEGYHNNTEEQGADNTSLYEFGEKDPSFEKNAPYIGMHCYGDNIITLLSANNKIEFWNYRKKLLLGLITVGAPLDFDVVDVAMIGKRIAFSSNNKRMLIASDRCHCIDMPFTLIYKPETIKKFCFTMFLLENNGFLLPKDIVNYIGMKLLACYPNEFVT